MPHLSKTFGIKVYDMVRQIPKGQVSTYGAIAQALGYRAYRAVGQVLAKSPGMKPQDDTKPVPCHRVIRSNGTIGGFGGHKSGPLISRKIKMLRNEGVVVNGNKVKSKIFFDFIPIV